MKTLKHIFYAMAATVLLPACSEHDVPMPIDSNGLYLEPGATPTSRSLQDAIDIVMQNMSLLDDVPMSRGCHRTIDMSNHGIKAVKRIKSRGSNAVGDTLFYVLNFENNAGYAVVAKDYAVTDPLIAITEEGYYDPEQECDNPGLAMYMDMATEYVEAAIARLPPTPGDSTGGKPIFPGFGDLDTTKKFDPNNPNPGGGNDELVMQKHGRDTIWFINSPAKIKLRWGQKYPEGKFCLNFMSGCSNTAAAMLMSYFEWPKDIALTCNGNFEPKHIDLKWNLIKKYIKGMDVIAGTEVPDDEIIYEISTAPDYIHDYIGYLCRELGYRNNSTYYVMDPRYGTSTGTLRGNLKNTLKELGFTLGNDKNRIYEDELYPNVYIVDGYISQNATGGHTWLMDGHIKYDVYNRFKVSYDKGRTWKILQEEKVASINRIHFNWGFYGASNGYFRPDIIGTDKAITLDNPSDGIAMTEGDTPHPIDFNGSIICYQVSRN